MFDQSAWNTLWGMMSALEFGAVSLRENVVASSAVRHKFISSIFFPFMGGK
jgi:hypothetical protein